MFNVIMFGFLVLLVILLYLGALERVLERMRLSERQAFLMLAAIILGGFLPDIPLVGGLKINPGGALIPLLLVLYLLVTADEKGEKYRALLAAAATGLICRGADHLLPANPGIGFFDIDPLILPALIAVPAAYVLGRSRRAAFAGAFLGVLLVELLAWGENLRRGLSASFFTLGGGGFRGAALFAGVLAVLLAEAIGEIRERLHRRG